MSEKVVSRRLHETSCLPGFERHWNSFHQSLVSCLVLPFSFRIQILSCLGRLAAVHFWSKAGLVTYQDNSSLWPYATCLCVNQQDSPLRSMYIVVGTAFEISFLLTSFLISYHSDMMMPEGFVPIEKNQDPLAILSHTFLYRWILAVELQPIVNKRIKPRDDQLTASTT